MSAHAKLSPSAAKRWMTCPGSIALIEHYREKGIIQEAETASDPALLGTALHEVAEARILGDEEPKTWIDFKGIEHDLDPHSVEEWIGPYVQRIRSDRPLNVEVEVKLEVSEEVWGTADCVSYENGTLFVDDLKTGHNKVEAFDNPQLLIYALGALDRYTLLGYEVKVVEVAIHQDRINHYASAAYTVEELEAFRADLEAAVEAVKSAKVGEGLVPSNDGCQWCPARAHCPALRAHAESVLEEDFRDMNRAMLGEAMDRIPAIKAWIKGVEDAVKEQVTSGKKVPGYKMVAGRKSRAWESEEAAIAYLKNRVPKFKATCFDEKLKSPAQMEKALKGIEPRGKLDLNEIIVVKGGNPTVVPEDDPREAMEYGDRAAEDFAEV